MIKTLLEHPDLKSVLTLLRTAPFAIRLVGGAVRDAYLERPVTDFDFAAACRYEQLTKFLQQSPCQIVRNRPQHGNILFTLGKRNYDITILRQDCTTDGRHAEIAATDSWHIDAERRDFTVNALSLDFAGQLHDPLQQGIADLKARRLCFIGAPRKRIREDYLRILRFFRFQGKLDFDIDRHDLGIISEEADGLRRLSRERIREEMVQILSLPNPILKQMTDCGLWDKVFRHHIPPDLGFLTQFAYPNSNWTLRLAAWFRDYPDAVTALSHDLVLTRGETQLLARRLTQPTLPPNPALWLYRYGRALSKDYWWLYAAASNDPELFQQLCTHDIPLLPISGTVLAQQGFSGATIRDALHTAETAWIASDFQFRQQDLLKILHKT
ncbi:MAG: CCA tRNA nucleotidyltransferase [Alphaproteobacteria bacterium]|nr:CCA tRNA nucleotidyltransferase [Alphaproteobacteria bacterium]